jgi:hypothetical protein
MQIMNHWRWKGKVFFERHKRHGILFGSSVHYTRCHTAFDTYLLLQKYFHSVIATDAFCRVLFDYWALEQNVSCALNASVCSGNELTGIIFEGVSKSFRTESITKFTLTTINTRWEATRRAMVKKLTRLTHRIAIQLHLVAESCTICSSRSRRPVRKLLVTPSYIWAPIRCSLLFVSVLSLVQVPSTMTLSDITFKFRNVSYLYC